MFRMMVEYLNNTWENLVKKEMVRIRLRKICWELCYMVYDMVYVYGMVSLHFQNTVCVFGKINVIIPYATKSKIIALILPENRLKYGWRYSSSKMVGDKVSQRFKYNIQNFWRIVSPIIFPCECQYFLLPLVRIVFPTPSRVYWMLSFRC